MISLSAKIRKSLKKEVKQLRQKGIVPAVLYGHKIKNLNLEVDSKEFENIYKEAGGSSLISLSVEGKKEKLLVLIYDVQLDSLSEKPIHIDFYHPPLKEEIEATVPIIFEGESPAVKNLEATLVKNISEIEVKALPQNLPKSINVNIEKLKDIEDNILVKDLRLPEGVKVLKALEDIVASVSPPEKVEEVLEKPIEEKVEEVERVKEKKEEKPKEEREEREEKEKTK